MIRISYSKGLSSWVALSWAAASCLSGCASAPEKPGVRAEVADAVAAVPDARVREAAKDGAPVFVVGDFGRVARDQGDDVAAGSGPDLARVAPVYGLRPDQLRLDRVKADRLGYKHYKYRHQIGGEDVIGSEVVAHVDAKGQVYATHGNARPGEEPPALAVGLSLMPRLGAPYEGAELSAAEFVYVLSSRDGKVYRAWSIVAEGERDSEPYRDRVFVDANSGAVVEVHPLYQAALHRQVYDGGNANTLPGALKRSEGQAPNGDEIVNGNYGHLGAVYDGYLSLFGRDSYDDAGAPLVSTVHHKQNYVNAFWNGSQMVYGDGDGAKATSLALSFDVTAHELTHAVTSSESGLIYQNESGAINEAISDIFGAVLEADLKGGVDEGTWKIGETVWTPNKPGDALRYMNNPTLDGYSADYYPERLTGPGDHGGVHGNSGIANHAFYLLSMGGQHVRSKTPSVTVPALGIEKAGQIWYRANTTYLTPSSTFVGLRTALRQSAIDLYDEDAAAATDLSMDAVGVPTSATPPPPTPPPPPVVLTNGQVLGAQSAAAGGSLYYVVDLPPNATDIRITTWGGSGDADLYGKLGAVPNGPGDATWRSNGPATGELLTPPDGTAGKLFLQLYAYASYSDVTVEVDFGTGTQPPTAPALENGVPVTDIGGAEESKAFFTFDVPEGATALRFATDGGTPDADLYVKFGEQPTTTTYDYRSVKSSNTERITPETVKAGRYYVMVHGYIAYSGLSLTASFTPPLFTPLTPRRRAPR